jgi:peptidoglycan LD-endopeptidase CwlK
MTDRDLNELHPTLLPLCQQFIAECLASGIKIIITETFRSAAAQDADYAQGRTKPGKVITNAKAGQSAHNCMKDGKPAAKAFDFAIQNGDGTLDWCAADPVWLKAIEIGEHLGLVSGSTFSHMRDAPHMELPNWRMDG